MDKSRKIWLFGACMSGLAGCAGNDPLGRPLQPDENDMAQVLGCTSDQIAVCIEVSCRPEHYRCTDRGDVRDMFRTDEFRQ